jgi:hypothetical protein
MKNIPPTIDAIRDILVRKCDTIFYATLAIVGILSAFSDIRNGEFSSFVYLSLVDAVFYRESLRLILWVQENPKYATACLFGVFTGAVASTLLKRPDAFLYEATVYLSLRAVAAMLFGLTEKEVFRLYVDVLFDYYDRKSPPRRPRFDRLRKVFAELVASSAAPKLALNPARG